MVGKDAMSPNMLAPWIFEQRPPKILKARNVVLIVQKSTASCMYQQKVSCHNKGVTTHLKK